MNRLHFPIIWLLVLTAAGCTKLEEEKTDAKQKAPMFWLAGEIADGSINLRAGDEGYYLFADQEYTDKSQVSKGSYTSDLALESCEKCGPSIKIWFKSIELDQSVQKATSWFQSSKFQYATPSNNNSTHTRIKPQIIGPGNYDIAWLIDGEEVETSEDINLKNLPPLTEVTLIATNQEGYSRSITNAIQYPSKSSIKADFNVDLSTFNPMERIFTPKATVPPVSWHIDGVEQPFPSEMHIRHTFDNDGVYLVEMFFPSMFPQLYNVTVAKNVMVGTPTTPNDFEVNYSYKTDTVPEPTETPYDVVVRYTDEKGEEYWSHYKEQSESSFFNVISAQEYDLNEKGQQTLKLEVEFSCELKHWAFEEELSTNLKGVIAVAVTD